MVRNGLKEEEGMKVPEVLTRDEIKRIQAIPKEDFKKAKSEHQRFNAIRNLAILRLLTSTGLRVSEVCNLNLENVLLGEKQLKIREGKFGNEDYQPIGNNETIESLKRYLVERERIPGKGRAFFISYFSQRILPRQIRRYIKDYATRAGITKNTHPHTFRHTFGTELLRATGNLRLVQVALRHKRISSTEIYTHIAKPELTEALEKAGL